MKKQYLPLLLILFVATFLRFYKFSELPFTHDEFSTIFRLNYDNINDVIQIGMKELDNHPVGMQVFYYYYTHLFGQGEKAVKLPIILFGIFSVFMVYLLGKKWFNQTAGLFAAAFMAVLQYCVVQSEIARMYGFGIPFVLLMVYYWDKLLHEKFTFKNAALFVLFAAICSYTHYFSLLFAAIVGFTGLFLVKKIDLGKYLLSCAAVVLLFVPHLNIFFYQLSKGGIEGWLGKFHFTYFFKYLLYVFHYSWFVGLTVVLPIVFLFNRKPSKQQLNYRYLSAILFLAPMLIGFTYSYFVNNVIHERVLYFSFPFLLLFLTSFIKQANLKKEIAMVIVILVVGTSSLFIEREHYHLFVNHRYKVVAESLIKWEKGIGAQNVLPVKFTYKNADRYYDEKNRYADSTSLYLTNDYGIKNFIELLKNSRQEYLYFGRASIIDQTYLQVALEYYPEMVQKFYTYAGEVYLLKRSNKKFKWPCTSWKYEKTFQPNAQASEEIMQNGLTTNDEYIGTVEVLLDTIMFSKNNFIELSTNVMKLDSVGGALLVSSMEKDGRIVDWRAGHTDNFIEKDSVYSKAMFTVPLPDIRFEKGTRVKFFLWNKDKANYCVKDLQIITRAGNPFIYGETEKIPFNKKRYCL